MNLNLDSREIEDILQMLSVEDKVIYSKLKADKYYKDYLETKQKTYNEVCIMGQFDNKVVVITGATSGIGEATAKRKHSNMSA